MRCPHCQGEIGTEDAIPKSVIRKVINDIMDRADSNEDRLRAADLLSKFEGYTGYNAKKEERQVGVMILHHSKMKRIPGGKSIEVRETREGDGKA